MASALHDANHVKLSRLINDPVASAASDGTEVSSALRNDYLNRANREIQLLVLTLSGGDWTKRRDKVARFIPGLMKTQSITWSTGSATLASDYSYWLELRDSGPGMMTYHPSKAELDSAVNPNIPDAFTILGTSIYGYASGSAIGDGATGTLYYVQTDARASAGDAADISIDAIWHSTLVSIAAGFYKEEKGEDPLAHFKRLESVLSVMRGM